MEKSVFIGRQPIITGDKNIFGYEILFRSAEEGHAGISASDKLSAGANMLEDIYAAGIKKLMGEKLSFINITPDVLKRNMAELLPKETVVLEILASSKIDDNAVSIIKDFKSAGFRFSLDDFIYGEEWEPLLGLSEYVKLDVKQYSKVEIKEMIMLLKGYGVKLIAEKVELDEDFQFYKSLGFDLFQGYFFQKPAVSSPVSLDHDYIILINIFNSFQANADIGEIEGLFKMVPGLADKLIMLINSVAYEFIAKISSVKQAIALLGYDNVSRWILTVVLASEKSDFGSDPLLESAMIKGRMMEIICGKYINKGLSDKAFLAGMISLVGIVLDMPLKDLFDKINIDAVICEALIDYKGKLGELVKFMEAYNDNNYAPANTILKRINPAASISDIFEINTAALVYLEGVKKSGGLV